jgi:hypothetical protein
MHPARTPAINYWLSAIGFLLIASCLLLLAPGKSFAQTAGANTDQAVSNNFTAPNVDPGVPQNQHIYAQAITIEVMSALICQLVGIDPIDPYQGCLSINPETRKLGLAKPQLDENGKPEIGGMIGITTDLIAATYYPPASTAVYASYLAENFGIAKKAHAQVGYGFDGLRPILKLWEAVRNIAYILLTLAFVMIGVGIMLRVKIDPRTVMTIQNQIPKVIIAIILITFSYAISALMIDIMWTTTYAGVNLLSDHFPVNARSETLIEKANKNLINNPISFTNQIFETPKPGVFHITQDVSNNTGELLRQVVKDLLNVDDGEKCFDASFGALLPGGKKLVNFAACAAGLVAFLASVTFKLVILVILMVTLFRIWFQLLKAYIFVLVYIIVSPVYIVFGLLPTKPLGFESWLRALFVNLATFPVTAFVIVAARLLMDIYNTDSRLFVPPLVGNPNAVNFGTILAFGALLVAPSLNLILKEKMGVKGIGSPGLVAAGIAGGAAAVGGPVSGWMKHLNRRDSRGQAAGALAVGKQRAGNWALKKVSDRSTNPLLKGMATRKLEKRRFLQGGEYASGRQTLHEWRAENPAERGNYFERRRARRQGGNTGGGTGEGAPTPQEEPRRGIIRRAGKRIADRINPTEGGFVRLGRAKDKQADEAKQTPQTPPTTPNKGAEGTRQPFDQPGSVPKPAAEGSVIHGADGSVTITGPVTATGPITTAFGKNPPEAKQRFIGRKVDEYVDKLKKKGESAPTGAKQNITVHIEEALKDRAPEDIAKMHEPDWEKLMHEAEEREKSKEGEA